MIESQSLTQRIRSLTREEALEAASALGEEMKAAGALGDKLGTVEEPQADARRFVETVEASPLAHIPETEELARLLLVVAADDEELRPTVEQILDAVGNKAFILGGLEIVALAALAVVALHVIVSRGRTSAGPTTRYKFDPGGNVTEVVVTGGETYGISASGLAEIVTAAAGAP